MFFFVAWPLRGGGVTGKGLATKEKELFEAVKNLKKDTFFVCLISFKTKLTLCIIWLISQEYSFSQKTL